METPHYSEETTGRNFIWMISKASQTIGALMITAIIINFLLIQDSSEASPGHGEEGHGDAIEGAESAYPLVTVVQPTDASSHSQMIDAAGTVLSQKQGEVYARREGVLSQLRVDLGDTVYKGQILAVLQPDRDQSEIAAEIGFKKRQLELARTRAEIKTDSHLAMAGKSLETVKQEQVARLNQINVQVTGLQRELSQKESQVETVGYDLIDTISELLFSHSNGISDYYKNSSLDYYRRRNVYYVSGAELAAKQLEKDAIQIYNDLQAGTASEILDGVITELIALGNEARAVLQKADDSPDFTYEKIDGLRKEIAATVDHIIETSLEYTEKESALASLFAEKSQIYAQSTRNVVDSEREKVEIESARKNADLDAEEIEAEITKLQQQLGASSTVYAPFSGVITKRLVNVGDSVNDEKPLFSLVDDSHKFVRFFVSENDLPFLSDESDIQFSPSASPSKKYTATIKRIAKAIDPINRTILVEADISQEIDDGRILTEMIVRVSIPVLFDDSLVAVPESVFELSEDQSALWIVNSAAEVEMRSVTVDYFYGGFAYVSDGITADDWIVIKSPIVLTAETPVDTTL